MLQYNQITLDNGLQVIVNEDKMTSLVAVNMLYKVGSKNENVSHTGFAHLFEHLMFSGSKNFPSFDTLINSLGGESNAFTNSDYTNFYITIPFIYLEFVLRIEADRMCNLLIDQQHLDVQKKVVCEEFKERYLNQPYGDLYKIMRETSYKVHPYRWQTIGIDISHIESATLDIVRDFYNRFYQPSNAILSISGNVKASEVFVLCKNVFSFNGEKTQKPSYPMESKQEENRYVREYRNVPASLIVITFPMCERNNNDFYIYDMLSDILSNGKSSRLYQSLVMQKQLFTDINAVVSGEDDPGLFIITGQYAESTDIEEGEKAIFEELQKLLDNPPNKEEFQKVKNKYVSNFAFNNIKILDKAMELGYYAHLNNIDLINTEKDYYTAVKSADVLEYAKQLFFINKHNTIYYIAKAE